MNAYERIWAYSSQRGILKKNRTRIFGMTANQEKRLVKKNNQARKRGQ